jgi:hypothetical protein
MQKPSQLWPEGRSIPEVDPLHIQYKEMGAVMAVTLHSVADIY